MSLQEVLRWFSEYDLYHRVDPSSVDPVGMHDSKILIVLKPSRQLVSPSGSTGMNLQNCVVTFPLMTAA
jgi:hypothetical protein